MQLIPAFSGRRRLAAGCGLLLALTVAHTAWAVSPVAILPLHPLGTEAEIAERLDATLRAEAARIPGITLRSRAQVEAAATRTGEEPSDCARQLRCLAAVGAEAQARTVAYGTVASLGQAYVLDLKLIDVRTRRELRRRVSTLSGEPAVLIEGVRDIAYALLAPAQYVGTLEVRGDTAGAMLYVDGEAAGSLPRAPVTGLKVDAHRVRITRAGFSDIEVEVPIRLARTTLVNLTAHGGVLEATVVEQREPPPPPPPPPPPAPRSLVPAAWALGGLGGALVLAGAVGLGAWAVAYTQIDATLDEQGLVIDPDRHDEVTAQQSLFRALGVGGAVALPLGLVGIGAGVLLALLSPSDDGEAAADE